MKLPYLDVRAKLLPMLRSERLQQQIHATKSNLGTDQHAILRISQVCRIRKLQLRVRSSV